MIAGRSYALDGGLDAAFGAGGRVATDIGASDDDARAIAIQSDGKIVAAGRTLNGANYDLALIRYNADGALDASFGAGGVVTTGFGAYGTVANAVAIQSDGKIVAAVGYTGDFVLVRYNADGALDASFDAGGIVTTVFAAHGASANALGI
ncbi:MAG: hypothetical protein HY894_07345 [Deltaproteobacteria bacterium]|nr:hypothetical protein [Deltaproteobacteria bacterium]